MRCLLAVAALLLAPPLPGALVAAQAGQDASVSQDSVLIDFQDADLRLVILALAEAGGLNVVHGELPARRVTLRMRRPVPVVEIGSILRGLAASNGLVVAEEGSLLRLEAAVPGNALANAVGDSADEIQLFVHRLKHVRAGPLAATLQALFAGAVDPAAGRSSPQSLSERLRESQGVPPAEQPDREVAVTLAPAAGTALKGQLKGELHLVADENTNALLIRATPGDWAIVKGAIEALDLRPMQVVIEVVIAEVRRTREFELSVTAEGADLTSNPQVTGTLRGNTSGSLVLEALRTGNLELSLGLSLLSSRGDVRIISRPVILAQNNQEARILIGSERPFVQVSRTLPTDAGTRDQVIQYRDVGTKLTITPTINEDGYVNLEVLQEVSTATAETQFGAPVISNREVATHLFVKDGRTVLLGGLVERQKEGGRSGIPFLMELPLIGGLFGSSRNTSAQSELFLFLTPHVVVTDEDGDRIRQEIVEDKAPEVRDMLRGAVNE